MKREQGQKTRQQIRAVKYLECTALTQRDSNRFLTKLYRQYALSADPEKGNESAFDLAMVHCWWDVKVINNQGHRRLYYNVTNEH